MSVFPKSLVVGIADTLGIGIKDEVAVLLMEDAEYRLREILHQSTKFMRHSRRKRLNHRDINSALSVKNVQPLYGYSIHDHSFKSTTFANQPLYYLDDAEIDLEELVNTALPPVPLEVTFTAHWLAIEGVQPRIVQNPTTSSEKTQTLLDKQGSFPSSKQAADTPLVKQVLTQQLQVYFDKITKAICSKEPLIQGTAQESLKADPGIQALLPYFVVFVVDTTTTSLKDGHTISSMLLMIESLVDNPHLFLDPYLHQILPAVITCVVAKHLDPTMHVAIRKRAAKLLQRISVYSGNAYPGLQARITKTLVRALLDATKPAPTLYGALYALEKMGPEVVDLLIIPNAAGLVKRAVDETGVLLVDILRRHWARVSSLGDAATKQDIAKLKQKWASVYGGLSDKVFSDDVEMH
ncbi:hypothetical protein HDV03_001817 [Kappamyces sp. JEL0829]|nr:hypothetical protein HDV03_001817 [Kappamyces sp. JEL0829]